MDWQEYKRKGEEIRQFRLERHRRAIYAFAMRNKLRYAPVQEWHIRIANDHTTLDLFPKSKRYHNLTTGKRGEYYNLHGFLKAIFTNGANKGNKQGNMGTPRAKHDS